jgi:hypothetical protein
MQSWSLALLAPAALIMMARWWYGKGEPSMSVRTSDLVAQVSLTIAFMLPFVALGFSLGSGTEMIPPASIEAKPTARNCFELHLPRQPTAMRMDWIGSQGGGRHHTVQVCMAYRGEHLHEVQPGGPVFTDGSVLRREFFLFPDALINDYHEYLRRTFWPGSETGIHLIFSVNTSAMSAGDFDSECVSLAGRIREHCRALQP